MPLYDYQCEKCQKLVEVRHGFNDTYSEACPQCGGQLKRVFNPAPIVFKGSGFYVTDSRSKKSGESSSSSDSSSSKESAA
jgi:putative FmdB family regulatory protein